MYVVMPMSVDDIIGMVQEVYMNEDRNARYCTFPFLNDLIVRLDGNFMDDLGESTGKIRGALKNADPTVRRNGEGLIEFMERVMREC